MSWNRIFHFRKSVVFIWLISYISILVIPLIISGFIYYAAERIVANQINATNTALLRQLKQLMDSRLEDISRLSHQIALNTKTKSIMYIKGDLEPRHSYIVTSLSSDFRFYKVANSYINSFYVYFKNSDTVLTDRTFARSELVYRLIAEGGDISYEEWIALLRKPNNRGYTILPNRHDDGTVKKSIAFLQPIPIEEVSTSEATVVILLEEDQIHNNIKSLEWTNQGRVVIIDENNNVLASTQSLDGYILPHYDLLSGEAGTFFDDSSGESNVISYISSEVSPMKYLTIIPKHIYVKQVEEIRRLTILGFSLCVLIGGLLSLFFLRKNYSPVSQLVKGVTERIGIPFEKVVNEYHFIDNALSMTLHEKENIRRKLRQQNVIMRSNLLMRLFKGRFASKVSLEEALEAVDIRFLSDQFAVILFFMEDYSQFMKPEELEESDENLNLIQFVIANIVEELAGQNHQGFVAEVDGMMTCLLNFREEGSIRDKEQELLRIASESQKIITQAFHIYFSVSVSTIQKGISGIPIAYSQAVEALEYRLIKGKGQILCYEDIQKNQKQQFYRFDLVEEQRLVNSIKTGDYEKSGQILKKVMQAMFSEDLIPIQVARCLIFDIASTLLKTIAEMNLVENDCFIESLNPVERLLSCDTAEEMQENMMEILGQVCHYIEQKKNSHNKDLKEEILNYIHEHYKDEDFSLTAMAEHLNLNNTYLSKFFKEQIGEGLLEYVNRYRISKAKELLKKSDQSISHIAKRVGFYNNNTFIRVFKKYEGITPGQYKEMA